MTSGIFLWLHDECAKIPVVNFFALALKKLHFYFLKFFKGNIVYDWTESVWLVQATSIKNGS